MYCTPHLFIKPNRVKPDQSRYMKKKEEGGDDKRLFIIASFEHEYSSNFCTINYGVAIVSFMALLTIIISSWQIINKEGTVSKKSIVSLISGIVTGLLTGFTTCLPLFL